MDPGEIHQACQGDRRALARLVDELLPVVKVEVVVALHRRAGAAGRDATQEVDDFVQDVLVYLLAQDGRVLRRWDPERGRSLASFVRLVARHRVARRLEGFRGNPWNTEATEDEQLEGLDFDGAGDDAFRHLASRERLARLLEHLRARLDERGLLLFRLVYVEQRPIPEVCETVGMSRAAVDQWSSRLRRWARGLADKDAI